MDKSRFLAKTERVTGTTQIECVKLDYLNAKYKFKLLPDTSATETGLVRVMELIPTIPEMPNFILRWDEKADTLDVDIYKNGQLCNELWDIDGYEGHHTQKIGNRIFKINIVIPNEEIFKGIINVGLLMEIFLQVKHPIKATLSVKVIRKKRLFRKIAYFLSFQKMNPSQSK